MKSNLNTKNSNSLKVVSFGKYKGEPIEALLMDKKYSNWLLKQDWFKKKFPQIEKRILGEKEVKPFKSIETRYKGYRFRSRLEARWATFFDTMKIEWDYEPQGFDLNGTAYLPDFFLPKFCGGCWVEVKPYECSAEEKYKAQQLAIYSGYRVWLCEGVPSIKSYASLVPKGDEIEEREIRLTKGKHLKAVNAARSARFDKTEKKERTRKSKSTIKKLLSFIGGAV